MIRLFELDALGAFSTMGFEAVPNKAVQHGNCISMLVGTRKEKNTVNWCVRKKEE